jgi:hypothetical protein
MMATKLVLRRVAAVGFVIVSLVAGLPALAGSSTARSSLDLVPPGAPLAVIVPNLAEFSRKAAVLNEALGLGPNPMADLLGELKHQTGMIEGIDDQGSFVLAMTALPDPQSGGDPPFLMFVPITNFQAFVGNFDSQPDAAGVTQLVLPDASVGFARELAGYAVIGEDPALVAAYQKPNQAAKLAADAGKLGSQCLDSGDALVVVNLQAIAPMAMPLVQQALDQARSEIRSAPEADPTARGMAGLVEVVINLYGDAVTAILRDGSMLVVTSEITESGVSLTEAVQFKPETHTASLFAQGGGSSAYMDLLPNQPYLFAGSFSSTGMGVEEMLKQIQARLTTETIGEWGKLIVPTIEMVRLTKGTASSIATPQWAAMMSGGLLQAVNVVETPDGKAYLKTYQDYIAQIDGMAIPVNSQVGPDGAPTQMTMSARYTPNVMQLNGVQVDQYQTQWNYPPQMMQEMGPAAPLFMMFGGMGQTGYLAAKGPYVVMTTSADPQLLQKTLDSLDQGQGLGSSPTLAATRKQALLSDDPSLQAYVNVEELVNTGMAFYTAMSGQTPATAPAQDVPPVVIGIHVEDGGVAGRLYVPMQAIHFGRDTIGRLTSGSEPGGDEFEGPYPEDEQGPFGPPPPPYR